MAFLQGIFGGGNSQQSNSGQNNQQPQQFQNPANNQQPNQQQQNPGNNNGSGGGVQNQQDQNANSQVNPLDPFMKLMTPSKQVLTEQEQKNKTKNSGLFGDNFTPDNISKTVGGVNFTQSLDPAKVTAALGGDQNAFMEVLNSAVQAGVSASVQMSHGMVEQGVKTGTERFSGDLDSRFRDFTLKGQTVDNPALQHPFGKALLSTVAKQIADANPRMSAQDVQKQATSMFDHFAEMMLQPKNQAKEQEANKGQMDWAAFVDEPQSR